VASDDHGQLPEESYSCLRYVAKPPFCNGRTGAGRIRLRAAARKSCSSFGPDGERQPEREIRERKAKAVCNACPVRAECLTYAVSRPEKYGTWGGLNEDERSSERRRRMRRANAA
jgi:hypothetical protein